MRPARRHLATSGFNPGDYGAGTLKGDWWADRITGLAENDPVSTWPDGSGLGNDATQAAGARPVYQAAVLNGHPGVLFTAASSQFMAANGVASVQSGTDLPVSVITVQKSVTVAAVQRYWSWGRSGSASGYMAFGQDLAPDYLASRTDDAGTFVQRMGGNPDTSAHVVSLVFTGTAVSAWQDGSNVINGLAMDVGAQTCNRFSLGCFGRTTNSQFLDGHLFRVIVYSSALAAPQRSAIEQALGAYYGIAVL